MDFQHIYCYQTARVITTGRALRLISITEKTAVNVINLRRTTEIENLLNQLELIKHICLQRIPRMSN